MSTFNLLNLVDDVTLKTVTKTAMKHYGVGACGPRGFYGTFDSHLKFETEMEKFLNVEEVILYSYGFSTMASAIPSYAKRTDIIFADELVNQAIYQGLIASRSTIKFFKHNDLDHLEKLLAAQAEEDVKDPKKAKSTRRFMVVEGLYLDTGNICNLKRMVELKYKYKVRLFVDESLSIGTLGEHGKGLTEYFNVPVDDIDIISGNLELGFANYGGFCAGSKYVIDHQRLSGAGYCFSASSPPMLAVAMCATLDLLKSEGGTRQSALKNLSNTVSRRFENSSYWSVEGHADSPVKHFRLKPETLNTCAHLEQIVTLAAQDSDKPVLFNVAKILENAKPRQPKVSLRVTLNCSLTEEELDSAMEMLEKFGKRMVNQNQSSI
ncbi:Serine palmitoyltransferase 1 [Cichlidogyrus casuarinus]|uniref:Serine palmitoyltransferase 1 n=1 Tax=Cichlidogyrus casuarinus TaxID=1844966 RepID=A0ABD2QCN1_9PLAT